MRDWFEPVFATAERELKPGESLFANFAAECSDFVRFNHGRVRQAMTIRQARLELALVRGMRRDVTVLTLSGSEADAVLVTHAIDEMRRELERLPEDPYLLYEKEPLASAFERRGRLPSADEAVADVVAAAGDADLVGILASGPVARGFASSLGARHWHEAESFLLDFSICGEGDKAVKSVYAGEVWDRAALTAEVERARSDAVHLARPPIAIPPGEYRAYLAPAALDELVSLLNWEGVSEKGLRTRSSALQRLAAGEAALSPLLNLAEATAAAAVPRFNDAGFLKPERVDLVRGGRHAGALVSPRTAREYGIAGNGANAGESMEAAEIAPGALARDDVPGALDTGILVSNLWYLNYSDRAAARITGMTRFASFWVERGRIVAPLAVMRFDDTLYRVLGEHLEALSADAHWVSDSGTYGERSMRRTRVPGALVGRMRFTL